MTNAEIGRTLTERRKAQKLTQQQLRALTGISQGYMSELETGKKSLSLGVASALEYALEAKRGELARLVPDLPPTLRSRIEDMLEYVSRLTRDVLTTRSAFPAT